MRVPPAMAALISFSKLTSALAQHAVVSMPWCLRTKPIWSRVTYGAVSGSPLCAAGHVRLWLGSRSQLVSSAHFTARVIRRHLFEKAGTAQCSERRCGRIPGWESGMTR